MKIQIDINSIELYVMKPKRRIPNVKLELSDMRINFDYSWDKNIKITSNKL